MRKPVADSRMIEGREIIEGRAGDRTNRERKMERPGHDAPCMKAVRQSALPSRRILLHSQSMTLISVAGPAIWNYQTV